MGYREDALKNSEEMLESDAIKFDQFLRDNEAQVNAAIRDAEGEAKKRQDRQVRPIRHWDVQIAGYSKVVWLFLVLAFRYQLGLMARASCCQ